MPFGFIVSITFHAALLAWALIEMRGVQPPVSEETPSISAEIITPSDLLRLKQGSEDAKKLETKAKDEPKPDDSKNETKKPDNAPPPPPKPQEVAKVEEPPPPEPPKADPPKPPEPDPIAKKLEEPPPPKPPDPAPGPTPDEQKALEQKLEEQRKADEAKKKQEEDAKKKAEDEARKKKLAEEAKKKKLAEEKKKADEAKKFDSNKLANLLNKLPDDAEQKALLDKDPRVKGQQAAGTSKTATATGKEAGTATGKDTVLSAREQDLLKGMIGSQIKPCWNYTGGSEGDSFPVVTLSWKFNPDGTVIGAPRVVQAPTDALGQIASETAVRAVINCAPYKLPADKYDAWKDIEEWTFDPRNQ